MFYRFVFTVLLLAVAGLGCGGQAPSANPAEAVPLSSDTDPIREVTAEEVAHLLDAMGNIPVLLNVWATWCPPCIAEMPYFIEFHEKYHERIPLISLSVDDPSTIASAVRPFHSSRKLPFPVYVLAERDPDELSKALKTEFSGAVPTTVLYDASGTAAKVWEGAVTFAELESAVNALR
jgi:thiol-disulfide isomerase/thioredoxin